MRGVADGTGKDTWERNSDPAFWEIGQHLPPLILYWGEGLPATPTPSTHLKAKCYEHKQFCLLEKLNLQRKHTTISYMNQLKKKINKSSSIGYLTEAVHRHEGCFHVCGGFPLFRGGLWFTVQRRVGWGCGGLGSRQKDTLGPHTWSEALQSLEAQP